MSLDDEEQVETGAKAQSNTDGVGPGHPPEKHQFKKGVSGNPKGRPKKPLKRHELLWAELRNKVKTEVGGKVIYKTQLQVIFNRLDALTFGGNGRARQLYFERLEAVRYRERGNKLEEDEPVDYSWTQSNEDAFQQMIQFDDECSEAELSARESEAASTVSPPAADPSGTAQQLHHTELGKPVADGDETPPTPKENDHD